MNGSRKPAASPTRNQPGPARRVTRDAERRRAGDAVARRSPPPSRPDRRRPGGSIRRARPAVAAAPSRASASRHDGPSTIPTLTRPPGTGASPTYPSRITTSRASRRPSSAGAGRGSATCQVSPTRGGRRAGRATSAARATTEWAPSAPTTTRAADPLGTQPQRGRPARVEVHVGDRDAAPDRGTGGPGQLLEGRVERRSVEADRRRATAAPRRTSAGPWCRRGSRAASRGPVPCDARRWHPRRDPPAQRGDGGGRGEDATGAPVPRRRPLEDEHLGAAPGQRGAERRPGRTRPDDRDVDADRSRALGTARGQRHPVVAEPIEPPIDPQPGRGEQRRQLGHACTPGGPTSGRRCG